MNSNPRKKGKIFQFLFVSAEVEFNYVDLEVWLIDLERP